MIAAEYKTKVEKTKTAVAEIDAEKKIGYVDPEVASQKKPAYVPPDPSWKQADLENASVAAQEIVEAKNEEVEKKSLWNNIMSTVQEKVVQPLINAVSPTITTSKGRGLAATVPNVDDPPPPRNLIQRFFDWLFGRNKQPKITPTVDTNAVETAIASIYGTMTAQAPTPTSLPMNTPTPINTPTPTATPMFYPYAPARVVADGINFRYVPSINPEGVQFGIPQGGQVYINPDQKVIKDGFCWSEALYNDPTINAGALPIANNFLNPLSDFTRGAKQGDYIEYSNGIPGWENRHLGNDFFAAGGNPNPPIVASAEGVIVSSGTQAGGRGYGNYVIVEYPENSLQNFDQYIKALDEGKSLYAIYGHLQENVSATLFQGTPVNAGAEIGKMGTTGNSDLVHLHMELRAGEAGLTGLTADTGDWYDPVKLEPVEPEKLITPNDTYEGWVARYQCDSNGAQIGESYLGGAQ